MLWKLGLTVAVCTEQYTKISAKKHIMPMYS